MQNQENTKEKTTLKEKILFTLVFFILTVVSIVFGVLSLGNSRYVFLRDNFLWLAIVYSVLITALSGLAVCFIFKEKEVLSKTLFSGYLLLAFCCILIFALQKTGFFDVIKDAESLQKYLENAGVWMPLIYILLQYLQVIILPIPTVVSTVAGVALFGSVETIFYSFIGIIAGSLTAFFIGRKLGPKAVAWMIGKDTLEKWQKKLKGKDNLFLTIMFILPMFPDDVLCFIAGLSSMTSKYFIGMIFISRLLTVVGTCFSFDFIPFNTWWGLLIWAAFFLFIVAIFLLAYKYMDKIQNVLAKRFKSFNQKSKNNKTNDK